MKLIESKVEYLPQDEGLEGVYKQIERCGRVSYKSEDKITEDSAEPFVDRMIKSKHFGVLEHGTVYLNPYSWQNMDYPDIRNFYYCNPYAKIYTTPEFPQGTCSKLISTNFRVLIENNRLNDLKYLCTPTEFHEKRYAFKFTCSRAIANELVRHRAFSFMQESQRFCNYTKNKFGSEVTFIKPCWYVSEKSPMFEEPKTVLEANLYQQDTKSYLFEEQLEKVEESYFMLLNEGLQPQQARDVLPNATKTELIMTGFSSDWRYLLDLRLFGKTGSPHPDMVDLMKKLQKVAEEAGIWEDIMKYPSKFC